MNAPDSSDVYRQFVALFARHERSIRAYVRSLLPSGNDVDDVMQEVGLACWKKFATFDDVATPFGFVRWGCVIARFEVLRFRRQCARDRLLLSEDVMQILAEDAESRLEKAEAERSAVEDCLQKFQATERRLLLSVHTPGDSVARVASELGQQARRLYTKVRNLRDLLAECVQRQLTEAEA